MQTNINEYAQAFAEGRLTEWPPIGTVIPAGADRYVKPKEAATITARSLVSQYRDRKIGKFPPLFRLGENSVGYLLSHLLVVNASREIVTAETTRPVAPGAKRGRKRRLAAEVQHP